MISSVSATVGKLSLVAGLVFIVLKIVYKRSHNEKFRLFYERRRTFLYQVHVNVSKLAVFMAFIHGFTLTPIDWTYTVTGWLFGVSMVALLGLGAYLSIKNDAKPMDEEDDRKWRRLRIVKWILTVVAIFSLLLHYKLYNGFP